MKNVYINNKDELTDFINDILKGQCHEIFDFFLSKNSTWAQYEQA